MENCNALKADSSIEKRILSDGFREIAALVNDLRTMSAGVYLETKRLRSFDDKVETPQVEERVQASIKEASDIKCESLLEQKIFYIKNMLIHSIDDLSSAANNIRAIV